jgi:hypothetical protein
LPADAEDDDEFDEADSSDDSDYGSKKSKPKKASKKAPAAKARAAKPAAKRTPQVRQLAGTQLGLQHWTGNWRLALTHVGSVNSSCLLRQIL